MTYENDKIKNKDSDGPWTTRGIQKPSERKQRMYSKFKKKNEKMKNLKKNIKITKSFLNLIRSGQRNRIFLN